MATKKQSLQFVVQKHAAHRLHYDFRLEIDGVLKSWAVPKGPSTNPADKRLAIAVEDHDLDYADFEGEIEEGQYGAGTVEIWDRGTVEYPNGAERAAADLEAGFLEFKLSGKRLKGRWKILRFKTRERNTWLLIKRKDRLAEEAS